MILEMRFFQKLEKHIITQAIKNYLTYRFCSYFTKWYLNVWEWNGVKTVEVHHLVSAQLIFKNTLRSLILGGRPGRIIIHSSVCGLSGMYENWATGKMTEWCLFGCDSGFSLASSSHRRLWTPCRGQVSTVEHWMDASGLQKKINYIIMCQFQMPVCKITFPTFPSHVTWYHVILDHENRLWWPSG